MIELQVKNTIHEKGSVTLDEFMAMVIPYYYQNNQVFGTHGDFITAPETSQMFGEMIGIWCAQVFLKSGSPKFQLLELGPGRGTLMNDLLRATKHVPGFHTNLQNVILVESSKALQDKGRTTLSKYNNVSWQSDLQNVPRIFTIIIANEFFDALPVKQFQVKEGKLHEVVIAHKDGKLMYSLSPASLPARANLKESSIIEYSPATISYATQVQQLLMKNQGACLIVDYGYTTPPFKSTLQALYKHTQTSALEHIGEADITYLVDFVKLQNVFADKFNTQITSQGEFLIRHGINERAKQLINNGAAREAIESQLNRLTDTAQMGELFKVLEINI